MDNQIQYKKYEEGDFDTFFELVQRDEVMKYVTGKGLTRAEARAKFDSDLLVNKGQPSLGYFMVIDASSGAVMGDAKLEFNKREPEYFEVGYLLKEAYWGQGLGTKVCAAMLELAEKIDPKRDIIGIIDPANGASKRLLEKFGFKSYFIGVEDDLPTEKLMLKKR